MSHAERHALQRAELREGKSFSHATERTVVGAVALDNLNFSKKFTFRPPELNTMVCLSIASYVSRSRVSQGETVNTNRTTGEPGDASIYVCKYKWAQRIRRHPTEENKTNKKICAHLMSFYGA